MSATRWRVEDGCRDGGHGLFRAGRIVVGARGHHGERGTQREDLGHGVAAGPPAVAERLEDRVRGRLREIDSSTTSSTRAIGADVDSPMG
jgi:hypothetical protein